MSTAKTAKTLHLFTLSLLACATVTEAQDAPPVPAKQLAKYNALAGTWEGTGTVMMTTGAPETKWTAQSTYRWVLGRHFLQEDTRIQMGDGASSPLVYRNFHGWDRENERYISYSIANMGTIAVGETHWPEDGTMVSGTSHVVMGQLNVERWVTKVEGDKMTMVGHNAMGSGDFYVHVRGEMKRTSAKAAHVATVNASFMPEMAGGVGKMGRFGKSVGTYGLKGWFIPAPGAPKMSFTGTETVKLIFAGTVLESCTTGDPIPGMPGTYEGFGYIAWDNHEKAYSAVWLNNMGAVSKQECRWLEDKSLVFTHSSLWMGQPVVGRGVLQHGADGQRTTFHEDAIAGTGAAQRIFEVTCEKKS